MVEGILGTWNGLRNLYLHSKVGFDNQDNHNKVAQFHENLGNVSMDDLGSVNSVTNLPS